MNVLKKYYKNKKVLITGHTGFKGSWLTSWLIDLNSNVIGISKNIPTIPSNYKLQKNKLIKEYFFDICNTNELIKVFKSHKPDVIFHLAAQSLVQSSFSNPQETIKTNTIGTLSILEALKEHNSKINVIFITSDKVYENLEWQYGYRENDLLGGKDPYSTSKFFAEKLIDNYYHNFLKYKNNVRIAIARAGNVIGGGDWSKDRILPDCFKAYGKNKSVIVRNPNSTRPWQHVLEPLFGYILLGISLYKNKKLHGESFNFGPDIKNDFPVIDLVKKITKNFDEKKIEYDFKSKKNFKESGLLKLNCEKANNLLKWKSILTFEETTDMTAKWYKNYLNNQNMNNFTNDQINKYIHKLKS